MVVGEFHEIVGESGREGSVGLVLVAGYHVWFVSVDVSGVVHENRE